jgi:hypothetical protein
LQTCGICLEDKAEATPPCLHTFCLQCILQWAQISNTCPLCKAKFNQIVSTDGGQIAIQDRVQTVPYDSDFVGGDISEDDISDNGIQRIK